MVVEADRAGRGQLDLRGPQMQRVAAYFRTLVAQVAQDLPEQDRERFLKAVERRFAGWEDAAADLVRGP